MLKRSLIFLSIITFSLLSQADQGYSWKQKAQALKKLSEESQKTLDCSKESFKELGENYLVSYNSSGDICGIYDLSFPTLRSLFSKRAVTKLRITKPKLKDYKIFLNNEASFNEAERFLDEELSMKDSWYSKLDFKEDRNLRKNSEGVYESFSLADVELKAGEMSFTENEKETLTALLTQNGRVKNSRAVTQLLENPRSIFDNISFEYDSLNKAYKVFLDLDFLPVNGPVKFADHKIQYRAWLQSQVRSLIHTALSRFVAPSTVTVPGRIANVVLEEAFQFVDMTYEYQRLKLEKTLRMALEGEIETEVTNNELQKSLYLLFVQDSSALISLVMDLVQTGHGSLDNLYSIGKPVAIRMENTRKSMSDQAFSKMYYKHSCEMEEVSYYFAKCAGRSSLYSLISETSLFLWSFGNPKVLNLNSPWEVFTKRWASYLLATAVEINFLNFPQWISSQVAAALKGYALSGVLDEALVVSDLLNRDSLNELEEDALKELMGKNVIPFLPRDLEGLEQMRAKNKNILGVN